MNGKAFAVLSSLFLLIGGASAYSFTVDFQLGQFLEDAQEGDTLQEKFSCNSISSYFVPDCAPPVAIEPGGATTTEVQWSITNVGAAATDAREQHLGTINKRLNASYGVSMAEAKQETIEDLNQGAGESIAEANASDIVTDWYSQIQANALNYRNRHVLKLNSSIAEVEKTDGLTVQDVFKVKEYCSECGSTFHWDGPAQIKVNKTNASLYDGEEVPEYSIWVYLATAHYDGSTYVEKDEWKRFTEGEKYNGGEDVGSQKKKLKVKNPDGDRVLFYNNIPYHDGFGQIKSTKDRAISNVRTVVGDIYSTYAVGEVNVSESLGPLETLKVASTSYESTGYYDYATLTAEQMGLNTNDTFAFTVEWNNTDSDLTYQDTGQLFIEDNAYNGTIEVGKEYNATDRTVWLTRKNSAGNIVQESLNGTFTVTDMINRKTGESVESTSVQEIKVYDSNVTDLPAQFEKLREALEEYQNEETGGTAGGTSATGLFGMSPAATGASAIAGVLALILAGVLLA